VAGPLLKDRVKQTTTTTGTGTVDLDGAAPTGFRGFVAAIGNGNTCYYCIVLASAGEWEVGIGTVTDAATDTLSRTTILASSNAGAAVNFSAGTKDVFCTTAADAIANLRLANTFTVGPQTIDIDAAGNKGLIIQMAASPTANPLELQDSTGAALTWLDKDGFWNFKHTKGIYGEGGAQLKIWEGTAGAGTGTISIGASNIIIGNAGAKGLAVGNANNVSILRGNASGPVLEIETTTTGDDPNFDIYQNRAATTDATQTTLQTIAISASKTYLIEARVVARRTGGTAGSADDGAAYVRRGVYKTVSGTVTLIGSVQDDLTSEDVAGWDCTLDISTTNVRVRVTGAADTNITWHSTVIVQEVGS
jgi:hypothetical protein